MLSDTTAPTVTCPDDLTVEIDDGSSSAVVLYSGESAIDNDGSSLEVVCDLPSNSSFQQGTNTVSCSATDASDNTGSCRFNITVEGM